MIILWRDSWLKPLSDSDIGSEDCKLCRERFKDLDFVTSCDFCEIGPMHDHCANRHILADHTEKLRAKVEAHKDKPLHDYQ